MHGSPQLSLGQVILYLSLIGALVEGYVTARTWLKSENQERWRGTVSTCILAIVAILTFADSNSVDGYVKSLRLQIEAQDATIQDEDKRVALALTRQKRDEAQLREDTKANANAKVSVNKATRELAQLAAANAKLISVSNATVIAAAATERHVSQVSAHVSQVDADTKQQVKLVNVRLVRVDADTSAKLHAIQRTTAQIAAKAGVFHLKRETLDALVKLLSAAPAGRANVACSSGQEAVCGDFDSLFKRAHWVVLTQRAAPIFPNESAIDEHGVSVWYKRGRKALADSISRTLIADGVDATVREDVNQADPSDIGITVRYIQP